VPGAQTGSLHIVCAPRLSFVQGFAGLAEIEGHGGHRDSDISLRSELDVELFQFIGLGFGAGNPFLHERHRHDGFAIGGALRIELYVVGEEARDDRRVHRISHARLFPEQVGPLGGGEAFAPDGKDAIDVGLRARPHLEAGRFIGSAERKLLKPECISPEIARQRARATRSAGMSLASGFNSLTYSAMASVSQTLTPSWVRQGTRNEGDSRRSSARVDGSSLGACCSTNSRPAILQSSHPRNDQEP